MAPSPEENAHGLATTQDTLPPPSYHQVEQLAHSPRDQEASARDTLQPGLGLWKRFQSTSTTEPIQYFNQDSEPALPLERITIEGSLADGGMSIGCAEDDTGAASHSESFSDLLSADSEISKAHTLKELIFDITTDSNMLWNPQALGTLMLATLPTDASALVVLRIEIDWRQPEIKAPAAFMYLGPSGDSAGDIKADEQGREVYVWVADTPTDDREGQVLRADRMTHAFNMLSTVLNGVGGSDRSKINTFRWAHSSRSQPSGATAEMADGDAAKEASDIRDELLLLAASEWREDGDKGHTSKANHKSAVSKHLDKTLTFVRHIPEAAEAMLASHLERYTALSFDATDTAASAHLSHLTGMDVIQASIDAAGRKFGPMCDIDCACPGPCVNIKTGLERRDDL